MPFRWQANWIWSGAAENTPNVYVEARKAFNLPSSVESAELRISANQTYMVWLNGTFVGRGPSPADCQWKYYDVHDVSQLLQAGDNAAAILAYNFGSKDIVTEQMQGPGGLIAQVNIRLKDGSVFVVSTDAGWKCRRSLRWVEQVSRQHQWNGFREIYRADQEDGWQQPRFNDDAWSDATVIAAAEDPHSPWPRLLEREIPSLKKTLRKPIGIVRIESNLGSVKGADRLLEEGARLAGSGMIIDASRPGSLPGALFDFGSETVGYVELEATAPEGGVLQLSYGESLELALTDTFLLKKGVNRLSPFGRRAFRYMHVSAMAAPQPIRVTEALVTQVQYPLDPLGSFECSDPLLNEIWNVGLRTTELNSQDHLEDCPMREGALWIADAVVMGQVIYAASADRALLRKCLLQGARIQNADGSIPSTGPERNKQMLTDFNSHWLFGVHRHWRVTRDGDFLRDIWPHVLKLMEWFAAQEDEAGLFSGADRPGWYCFIDWASYLDRRDRVAAMNCFYYKTLLEAANLAEAAGAPELVRAWRSKAASLRTTIRESFWVEEAEAFADCLTADGLSDRISLQTNFAAIWCGVMEAAETERFLERYGDGAHLPQIKGAFFYSIVLEALFSSGRESMALDRIREYWGEMLARGATTWWETFDPETPRCTVPSPYQGHTPTYLMDHIPVSYCHGWGASPTYLLNRHVLGVDVSDLGSGKVTFRPWTAGLRYARGVVPTPFGAIEAQWSKDESGIVRFEALVPPGVRWSVAEGDRIEYRIRTGAGASRSTMGEELTCHGLTEGGVRHRH